MIYQQCASNLNTISIWQFKEEHIRSNNISQFCYCAIHIEIPLIGNKINIGESIKKS